MVKNFYLGLKKEFMRTRWLELNKLWPMTFIAVSFSLFFAIYFLGVDFIVGNILKFLQVQN